MQQDILLDEHRATGDQVIEEIKRDPRLIHSDDQEKD